MKKVVWVPSGFLDLLVVIIMWIGIFLFIAGTFLGEYYVAARPKMQQPEVGRIYSMHNHGIVGYLTKTERLQVYLLEGVGSFFAFGGLIFLLGWRVKVNKKDSNTPID